MPVCGCVEAKGLYDRLEIDFDLGKYTDVS